MLLNFPTSFPRFFVRNCFHISFKLWKKECSMNDLISPAYLMELITQVEERIWKEYESYKQVRNYISKWHEWEQNWENFRIYEKEESKIDLNKTLHEMSGDTVMKIAIDMGVDTPDFIPAVPVFRNEIKNSYENAYETFNKAFKQIETDPDIAIGLANSVLESILKEILKDERLEIKIKGNETLYKLVLKLVSKFNFLDDQHPKEIKAIGSSLLKLSQAIENIRSNSTNFHGKTSDDFLVDHRLYAYFIINSVTTVGTFLISYYKELYPSIHFNDSSMEDDLPF